MIKPVLAALLAVTVLSRGGVVLAAAADSTFDLVGRWEGQIEFGKMSFKMGFRVAPLKDNRRVAVTMNMPDQGGRDMPCSAILYNPPDVRIETDQPPGVINGKINADRTVIDATFSSPEIPGGKPMKLVLKRNTEPEKPEPKKTYDFAPGEATDIRGYWKGAVEFGPGMMIHMGLKVGRLPDGSFVTRMDAFDFGGSDIPAASTSFKDGLARFEWQGFQSVFEARLDAAGTVLAGKWKQRGADKDVSFARLDKPATALPEGVSFDPDKGSPRDIRGHWEGGISENGRQTKMLINIGQLPDKTYAGSLVNRSQGPGEAPAAAVTYDGKDLKMEWKLFNATFKGSLAQDGTRLEGTWEQGGGAKPMSLRRAASN